MTDMTNAARPGQLTAALLIEELDDAQPNAAVVIHQGDLIHAISAVELRGATVRLHTAASGAVPVEQLQAMIRLLWPEEMTPIAKRQLESLIEQHRG